MWATENLRVVQQNHKPHQTFRRFSMLSYIKKYLSIPSVLQRLVAALQMGGI